MPAVDRKALIRALKIVKPAVAKTSQIPTLMGVRLLTTSEGLTLTASNLDLTIGTVLDHEPFEPFEVIASPATLGRILAAGRETTVHLAPNDDGTLAISSGSTASMRTIAGTFQAVDIMDDDATDTSLTAEDMEQISRVMHAASLDPQRVRLCGIHMAGRCVEATDSFRAARAEMSVELPDMLLRPDVLRSVIEHAVAPVGVRCDAKRVQFTSGTTTWITPMIPTVDESYPDMGRLIDAARDKCTAEVKVSTPDLLDLLDRLRSLATVTAHSPVLLTTESGHLIGSRDVADVGSMGDYVDADGTLGQFKVNPSLLIDAVEHARVDEVTIHSAGPLRPALIETPGYVALVMPVRSS